MTHQKSEIESLEDVLGVSLLIILVTLLLVMSSLLGFLVYTTSDYVHGIKHTSKCTSPDDIYYCEKYRDLLDSSSYVKVKASDNCMYYLTQGKYNRLEHYYKCDNLNCPYARKELEYQIRKNW